MTIAEQLRAEGRAEGMTKGMAKGIAKGKIEGRAEGIAEGIAKGKIEGISEGVTIEKIETAKRLLSKGGKPDFVSEITHLHLDKITEVQEKEEEKEKV